jgi:hypothetical protein
VRWLSDRQLSLESLLEVRGVSENWAKFLHEAAAVCLAHHAHETGKELKVDGKFRTSFYISWQKVESKDLPMWRDMQTTVENGAYGIAILLIIKLTDYESVERAVKGNGFDYWLGYNSDLFQRSARLEVSGILEGGQSEINARAQKKIQQTIRSDNIGLPAYIVIVEFSIPKSNIRFKCKK